MIPKRLPLPGLCPLIVALTLSAASAAPIEFRDGDRVVLIGNTFIERAQSYGHLETWLTTAMADRDITFRNLGWSGDTVFGHARSYFGPPQEGFERLTKHLEDIKPTLIISAYGAVAAFEGQEGMAAFIEGYRKLLAMFQEKGARVVLMSAPPAENLPAPFPNQDAHNENLALYRDAIAKLAEEDGHGFADVYGTLKEAWPTLPHPLTDNGLHFTDAGYQVIAPLVAQALGITVDPLSVDVQADAGKTNLKGAAMEALSSGPDAVTVRLRVDPGVPQAMNLTVKGLAPGKPFNVATANRQLLRADAETLAAGITLAPADWNPAFESLARAVHKKNELFFHRWRPQNETYLFGFRKHEQGNNAVEIPQFEPLIAVAEERIRDLKQTPTLTLTITR